jgi:uncharacterized protein YegL
MAKYGWVVWAALLALAASPAHGEGDRVPVAIAIDTSRSITQRQLEATKQTVAHLAEIVSPNAPVGVIAFNDEARWVAPLGTHESQLAASVHDLVRGGHVTVLRDALYLAATQLSSGGVIVLFTDGRDEDSAATVEDVARVCGRHHVQIVAVPVGGSVDLRALRRLALLTGGTCLAREADALAVEKAVAAARATLASQQPPAPTPPPAAVAPATPPPPQPRAATSAPTASIAWLPALTGALVVALVVAGILLWRRRPRTTTCSRCGSVLAPWETECATCLLREAQAKQTGAETPPATPKDEAALPPEVFDRAPLEGQLDRTFALQDQPTITVREQRKPPRAYVLRGDDAFSVGRAPRVNTLVLTDPTLSAQHFKIVPKDGEFFVVDLQTTNGTIVNGDRVRARKLRPGDVIRAGEVEFEYSIQYRRIT